MAIQWQWKDKMGHVVLTDGNKEWTNNLYKGNCLMVEVHEYEEDGKNMYTLAGFMADKEHGKNMLGLSKKMHYGENRLDCFPTCKKIALNTYYKEAKEIAKLYVDAKWKNPLQIELYYEEPKDKEDHA